MDECIHGLIQDWCATCKETDGGAGHVQRSRSSGIIETKQDILDEITGILGLGPLKVSAGSSIPSSVFSSAASRVGVATRGSMPEVLERIIAKTGGEYSSTFDSRASASGGGSTVTIDGLRALRTALKRCL